VVFSLELLSDGTPSVLILLSGLHPRKPRALAPNASADRGAFKGTLLSTRKSLFEDDAGKVSDLVDHQFFARSYNLGQNVAVKDEALKMSAGASVRENIASKQPTELVSRSAAEIVRLCDRTTLTEKGENFGEELSPK
jgi:hypothetical protein